MCNMAFQEKVVSEEEIISERKLILEVTCKYCILDFKGKETDWKS